MKTQSRVACALLCGLALCCSVMYITADGNEIGESVLAAVAPSVAGMKGPMSVDSEDVEKAGTIFTNTPDGRMRLTDYLANVEKEIAAEEAARKKDVKAVREQMARNFAFNKNARKKLKAALLKKMAANAKAAKEHLAHMMRVVQKKFHDAAKLAEQRNKANIARSKKLRRTIARNKKKAHAMLEKAVAAQQKSQAALASKIHNRIKSTDKAVAKNAAQIKHDAKEAKKELDHAVGKFDKKLAAARSEAAAGRSKLAQQLASQDKSIRAWSANKLKVVAEKTAARFQAVRAKMAEDRHHADAALEAATGKMTASLNAFKALQNKRFQKTVKDLAAARKEAKDKVAAASAHFKSRIIGLRATVNQQVAKTNARIKQLSGVVEKNKVAQAKINANVEAEMKRMVKLGNERYKAHLAKDKELHALINKNQAATQARMKAMARTFSAKLDAVRATMNKNRAHASKMLAQKSASLYTAIAKSEKAQMKINGNLAAQTNAAKAAVADELRTAKADFAKRLGGLHATVVKNDKKFEKKIDHLAGVVRANAVKNAEGRKQIAAIMKANKAELSKAVSDAVHKGEERMMQTENSLKALNAKTKAALNMRITAQVTKLQHEANSQIEGLRLMSKEARAEMRKEMLEAVRAASDQAKKNLKSATEQMAKEFQAEEAALDAAKKKSAGARAKIAATIKANKKTASRSLKDAVKGMEKTLLALKTETREKIKKTNRSVTAYGDALKKEADDVKTLMDTNMKKLTAKIDTAEQKAAKATNAASAASVAGFKKAMKQVKAEMAKSKEAADAKFAKHYAEMAKHRSATDVALSAAVTNMNDSIAKQAALADSRFSKTVSDIKAARKQAAAQVSAARKNFATELATVTVAVKNQESRLMGDIEVVAETLRTNKAAQLVVNRHTNAELKRVRNLVNMHHTESKKARGKIRKLLDENKKAAAEEVDALDKLFNGKIAKIRSKAAQNSVDAANDLTKATKSWYNKLAVVQVKAAYENKQSAAAIAAYEKQAAAGIAGARKSFEARLNQLTNVVAADAKKVESGLEVLTGVVANYKKAGADDRALIRKQKKAMGLDMNKRIVRAIQRGEAQAKKIADHAMSNLKGMKKAMLIEIAERVESGADKLFESIQKNHAKLSDNYLSLKAYAVTAEDKLTDYVTKGKGRNLSSLGDVLSTVASLADVKEVAAEGVGMGSKTLPAIFTGASIKVSNSVSKINALVNEYTNTVNSVGQRWSMGLGKYLLSKLEESMLAKGVLQVDKIDSKSGNFVFLNGHAVGLSNKLNDFETLAVRMGHYEATLAKLTAALSGKVTHPIKKKKSIQYASPPEYQGN